MKEKNFNTEVKNSFIAHGHWAYKIPDFPQAMVTGARFNPIKPFDIMAVVHGYGVAVESKMLKKYEAFGGRHLREEQIQALDDVKKSDGRPFVFLNIRQPSPNRLNRLIVFDWNYWADRFKSSNSIKKNELESLSFIEGRKKLFDLTDFFDAISNRVYYGSRPRSS